MDSTQFHSFLYDRTDFEKRKLTPENRVDFSLNLISRFLAQTGQMQLLPPALHVAGTNGKGSVCFYLEQGLLSAGSTTGTFLSPHVEKVNERIRINGEPVDNATLFHAAEKLIQGDGDLLSQATTFEILFLLAVEIFATASVDYCIFETGLGGRLDTTNLLQPLASVITPISKDHTAILGESIAEIAYEKAGIIKPGIPCFSSPQLEEAAEVIRKRCRETASSLFFANPEEYTVSGHGITGFQYRSRYGALRCRMPGKHQPKNLHLALTVLNRMQLPLDMKYLTAQLTLRSLPARMEYFPGEPAFILDGGHNPAAASTLAELLRSSGKRMCFVTALQADKDFHSYLQILSTLPGKFFLTTTGVPRSASPEELAESLRERADLFENPSDALSAAREEARTDEIIVICGSFYLCGELRKMLPEDD